MGNVCVLLILIINTVFCYHFYNPATHQLLELPSLNNIPRGYKLIPPPRSNSRRSRLIRGGTNGQCGDGGFTCNAPYDKSQTFQFECSSDDNCPRGYKCCPQRCFLHKICMKTTSPTTPSKVIDKNNCDRPGQCDKWPYNCRVPYHYSATYQFKCNRDTQCPKNFKCCQQSCFLHKICSRIVTSVTKITRKLPTKTTETVPTKVTETVPITETTTDIPDEELIEARYPGPTMKEDDETTETTSSTTTESTTVTEEVSTTEDSEETETTTVNYEEETTAIEIDTTPQQVLEAVGGETEESTEAEFKTAIVEIPAPTVKSVSERTTLDSNAINPEYAEYYYHYDNATDTPEDDYEDDENYDYDEENSNAR